MKRYGNCVMMETRNGTKWLLRASEVDEVCQDELGLCVYMKASTRAGGYAPILCYGDIDEFAAMLAEAQGKEEPHNGTRTNQGD